MQAGSCPALNPYEVCLMTLALSGSTSTAAKADHIPDPLNIETAIIGTHQAIASN